MDHRGVVASWLVLMGLAGCAPSGASPVERGKYLVEVLGCGDCHTPGGMTPKPDPTRVLAGSDVDIDMPGLGVFTPPNLTPDSATGLGTWSTDQIVRAFTTGVTPDGRLLSAAMPWTDYAHLHKDDARAIAAYLKSLPAVNRATPGPRPATPCAPGALQCIIQRPG